jgi:drug/metabolite transporter (DMT)-like permease
MRQLTGSILVVIAAVCFGFMGLFGSWAMDAGVSVEMMLFLRFAIGGSVMALLMIMLRLPWPRGGVLAGLIAMGAVLYVGEAMFFFHGTRHIAVGLVSLLLYVYPVIVTVFACLFLHERLTPARLVALTLAVCGLALTIGPMALEQQEPQRPGALPWLGVVFGLGCCVSYAIYILVGGGLTRSAGAIPASTVVILSAAVVLGGLAFLRGDSMPDSAPAWTGIILLALASTVIAITGILVGLARIGPVQTSTLSTLEPVTTVLVGALLMGQRLSPVQMLGGGLIVAAAVIIARSAAQPNGASNSTGDQHGSETHR